MKLFVLEFTYGQYSDFNSLILGVFSSEEKCKEAMQTAIETLPVVQDNWNDMDRHHYTSSGRFNIIKMNIDTLISQRYEYNDELCESFWNETDGIKSSHDNYGA